MKQNRLKGFALVFLLFFPGLGLLASGGEHGIDAMELVARFVNFIVFFGGLGYILKKPVVEFFSNRVEGIRKSLEKAESSQKDARSELDRIEDKMKALGAEVEEINALANKQAEARKAAMLAQAKVEAERIVAQAQADVDNMRREAVRELRTYITDIAIAEAEKTIRETMTGDDRKRLFGNFTAHMGAK